MAVLTQPALSPQSDTVRSTNTAYPVAAGVTVYEGGIYAVNASGELVVPTGALPVAGVALSGGVGDDGDRVTMRHGCLVDMPGTIAANNELAPVYAGAASDNPADITLTANTGILGYITEYTDTGVRVLLTLNFRSNA